MDAVAVDGASSRKFDFSLVNSDNNSHHFRLIETRWGDVDAECGEHFGVNVAIWYLDGTLCSELSGEVVVWRASAEAACKESNIDGAVDVGGGVRRLPERLRGIGVGTIAQSILVKWAMSLTARPVLALTFARSDVVDPKSGEIDRDARERRLQFWEKFGFKFDLDEEGLEGTSQPMLSECLLLPPMVEKTSDGWNLQLSPSLRSYLESGDPHGGSSS